MSPKSGLPLNRIGTIELTGEVNDRTNVHPYGEDFKNESRKHAIENYEAAAMKRVRDKQNISPD
jgi:hypothetical protein